MNNETPLTPDAPCHAATAPRAALDVKTVFQRLGPAGPLAVIAATLPAIGGITLLFLIQDYAGPWLKSHGALGVLIYIAGFALLSGFALLPTYAQSVLGGWAFGMQFGLAAALAGFLGGALLGYAIGVRAAGDRAVQLIREQPKWEAIYAALVGSGFWRTLLIVGLIRLNSPFSLTNFVLAAARTNVVAYAVGTLLGLAPRTAAAVFIGAGLKELTFEGTGNLWFWIGSVFVLFIVVLIIGQIATHAVQRVTARQPADEAAR